MRTLGILALLLTVFFTSFPPSSPATTVLKTDFADLVHQADLVFVGTVTHIECIEHPSIKKINTYVTFSDLEVVVGSHDQPDITVRFLGGIANGWGMEVCGMPVFELGERNCLFLVGNNVHMCPLVGWEQGRFKIIYDQALGMEVVCDNFDTPITEIKDLEFVPALTFKPTGGTPKVESNGNELTRVSRDMRALDSGKRLSLQDFILAIKDMKYQVDSGVYDEKFRLQEMIYKGTSEDNKMNKD